MSPWQILVERLFFWWFERYVADYMAKRTDHIRW